MRIVACALAGVLTFPSLSAVRLEGPLGAKLDSLVRNHLGRTDAVRLADYFRERGNGGWRTEFWGKYMHAAVPFWKYSGDDNLGRQIKAGFETLLACQDPDGYLGNYNEESRFGQKKGWDVWGVKYTLMGLLHYFDGTGDDRALKAAEKLCECLIAEVGPNGHRGYPLYQTGNYGGLPSCSVLEPVVWLYRRTKEKRFLDFATSIVRGMTEAEDGPRLLAQADTPVVERKALAPRPGPRNPWGPPFEHELTKAYELMSCYQGLLEYGETVGRNEFLIAAEKTARNIAKTEINLVGGASAGEHWFNGARQQTQSISWQQETCVTITWMRLCQKLLSLTEDAFWADQLEKTFYGAYLASVSSEMDVFAAYTPLNGSRSAGHHHNRTHTNCCNANGPRGYLSFLESVMTVAKGVPTVNQYVSGTIRETLSDGRTVDFSVYTRYPREGAVHLQYDGISGQVFPLRLRIPAFSGRSTVSVNGEKESATVGSGYHLVQRTWRKGDCIDLAFDLPIKMHRLSGCVAFTRGPIVLVRETAFADGALDEEVRADDVKEETLATFRLVQSDLPGRFMTMAAFLPMGSHTEDPDNGALDRVVRFSDYASAGSPWSPSNRCRVWLPVLIPGRAY